MKCDECPLKGSVICEICNGELVNETSKNDLNSNLERLNSNLEKIIKIMEAQTQLMSMVMSNSCECGIHDEW